MLGLSDQLNRIGETNLVSHEHKCIFIHIPKCAGTSIELALGHHSDYSGRGRQDHRTIRQLQRPLTLRQAVSSVENLEEILRTAAHPFRPHKNPKNEYTVSSAQYDIYFKFAFVRNPWARAYSWYANVIRDDILSRKYNLSDEITFPEYIKFSAGKDLLKPQTYWMKDYSGRLAMDFIGKFENLAEDYRSVCEKLNLEESALPHLVKGSNEDYREHYDPNSISIINRIYREEIELFNYHF